MSGPVSKPKLDRHVHELDIAPILTFACVIGVHTISSTNVSSNPLSNGAEILLHFTREAFFFLTGFVLMHQYGGRSYDLIRFYRRRILLVGGPYLAWTALYTLWRPIVGVNGWAAVPHQLGYNALFGTAWYHLYFLLVSLQIYLLFPLICRLVNATRQHALVLLGVSGLLQLGLLWQIAYHSPSSGWAAHLNGHQDVFVWNYQFWILLGAVAAVHRAALTNWIAEHRRAVAGLSALAAGLTLAWYCRELMRGIGPGTAAAVLQPIMVLWSSAAIAGLLAIGTHWRAIRQGHPGLQAAVNYASDRSFGIFLVHPLILSALLAVHQGWFPRQVGNPELTVFSYLIVVTAAVGVTELLRRSPASLILTGRPQLRHRKRTKTTDTLVSVGRTESVTPIG